jgi:hypothetical protein
MNIPMDRLIYDEAHRWQDADYSLVALEPGGKRPLLPGWQTVRSTHRLLDEWFGFCPAINVGLHCGLSRISVLDCDSPEAADWVAENFEPTVWWQESASAVGRHYPYFDPDGRLPIKINLLNIGLDTRSRNAQIVASPSYSRQQRRRWIRHGPLVRPEELPLMPTDWLADATRATEIVVRPEETVETPDMKRVFHYLDKCDRAVQGNNGSARFFGACCRILRAFDWLSWDSFVSAATHFSDTRSDPSFSTAEILHKCQDSWRKERS